MSDQVRSTYTGGITEIIIDRPPVNALDFGTIEALASAFEGADRNNPILLTGGGSVFSAGVDTKAFAAYTPAEKAAMIRAITRMTASLVCHPAPVIAAVNGHALGGGFVLMLCADVRLITDAASARFGLTESQAGVPFPAGPLEIIREEIEPSLLRRLTLTSQVIGSDAMMECGIADQSVPQSTLIETARARALTVAAQPAFTRVKQQVRGRLMAALRTLADSGIDPLAQSFDL